MPQLETERLRITSFTAELVAAALDDRARLEQLLGARVPAEWPGSDFAKILPMMLRVLTHDPGQAEWSGLIIHAADRVLVGDIGCKGGPDDAGLVEIGYSIVPAYQGRGYATEAARAIVSWALTQPYVRGVTAECLVANIGSIRVLEKLGMRRVGLVETEEGTMYRWELS